VTGSSARFVLVKNAIANVVRGSAAALVALILPPFLVRALSSEAFGVWSLVLQLSAYTAFLDFGVQTAVGRFVAHANELQDREQRDRIVNTSLALLLGSALLAALAMLVLAWQLPNLFRDLPPALYDEARLALLIVGGAAALGLPASVFNGIFIGLQRNEVPAAIIGGSRLLSALLLIATAYAGGSIVVMAAVVAAVNLLSYLAQFWASRRLALTIPFGRRLVSRQAAREIAGYCFSLSIWTFAGMLVTGMDLTIVGIVDFEAVGSYSIAASLITFITGLQSALFSTLIPEAAVLGARDNAQRLGGMLISSTRYGMFILLVSGLPLIIGAHSILTLWVGPGYAANSALLLQILVAANIIRLALVPYAMLLIGTGQQRLVTLTPLAEGFSNLIVSVIAGWLLGAVGVAIGTLVGAIVGVGCHLVVNMPRTTGIAVERRRYLQDGLLRSLVGAIPFLAVGLLLPALSALGPAALLATIGLATIASAGIFWRWGLEQPEQHTVAALLAYPLQALSRK
jgi:O-antigen/teichoic acid export membrane protein